MPENEIKSITTKAIFPIKLFAACFRLDIGSECFDITGFTPNARKTSLLFCLYFFP